MILGVQEERQSFYRSFSYVIISINGEPDFLVILKRFKDPQSISQPCMLNMHKWSDFYFYFPSQCIIIGAVDGVL